MLEKNKNKLGLLATMLIPSILYLITLPQTITSSYFGGRGGEFLSAIYTNGIPSFYSNSVLYILFAKLWQTLLFFISDHALRINLMSVFFALLTIYFLFKIIFELFNNVYLALFSTLFFSLSQNFWQHSIVTENTTFLLAIYCGFIYLLIYTYKTRKIFDYLNYLFLILGIGVAADFKFLFILPPFLLFLMKNPGTIKKPVKNLFYFILPPVSYLYFYFVSFTHPHFNLAGNISNPGDFFNYLFPHEYYLPLFWYSILNPLLLINSFFFFLRSAAFNLTFPVFAIGFLGIISIFKNKNPFKSFFIQIFFLFFLFNLFFYQVDKFLFDNLYFQIILIIFFSAGTKSILDFYQNNISSINTRRILNFLTYVFFSFFIFFNIITIFPDLNISNDVSGRQYGEKIFSNLPQNSLIIISYPDPAIHNILHYYQNVIANRSDILIYYINDAAYNNILNEKKLLYPNFSWPDNPDINSQKSQENFLHNFISLNKNTHDIYLRLSEKPSLPEEVIYVYDTFFEANESNFYHNIRQDPNLQYKNVRIVTIPELQKMLDNGEIKTKEDLENIGVQR